MSDTLTVDLSGVFGPVYWGFVISTLLGGITILQAYIYFPTTKDKLSVQIIAGCMLVFDLVSSALIAQSVYYYLIPRFGSLGPLGSLTPELSSECIIGAAITLISQLYFANQIYAVTKLRGHWIVALSVVTLAVMAFAGGIGCGVVMFMHNHSILAERNATFSALFGIAKGIVTATDIVATVAMCYYLSSARTGLTRSNEVLNWLIHLVIHRGILVTVVQTGLLIIFYAAPNKLYWLAFHVNVTKLYANIFFAMLNARNEMARGKSGLVSLERGAHYSNSASLGYTQHSSKHDVQITRGDAVNHTDYYEMKAPEMPMVSTAVVVSD